MIVTMGYKDPLTGERDERRVEVTRVLVARKQFQEGMSIHAVGSDTVPSARNWAEYVDVLKSQFGATPMADPDPHAKGIRCWIRFQDQWRIVTVEWPDKPADAVDYWAGAPS